LVMMKKLTNLRQEIVFQDQISGRFYRRVVGALGWPAEPQPGFIVVMGERYAMDPGLQARPLDILGEREVDSIAAIHQACLELRKEWACDTWLADLQQHEAVRLFRKLNRPMTGAWKSTVKPVWLREAPYSQGDGKLHVLFQMLGMVQSPERKLLSYGKGSKLPGLAMALDQKDYQQPAARFPALAALGYAVAEMLLREPWSDVGTEQKVVNDWDRFSVGG
jgi:hypothetical protein